jgi:hypothetical protein
MDYKILEITSISEEQTMPRKAILQFYNDASRSFYAFLFQRNVTDDVENSVAVMVTDEQSRYTGNCFLCYEKDFKKLSEWEKGTLLHFLL